MLSEQTHNALIDLRRACAIEGGGEEGGERDEVEAKTFNNAYFYREWLVTYVGCLGDFGALKHHEDPYEFVYGDTGEE